MRGRALALLCAAALLGGCGSGGAAVVSSRTPPPGWSQEAPSSGSGGRTGSMAFEEARDLLNEDCAMFRVVLDQQSSSLPEPSDPEFYIEFTHLLGDAIETENELYESYLGTSTSTELDAALEGLIGVNSRMLALVREASTAHEQGRTDDFQSALGEALSDETVAAYDDFALSVGLVECASQQEDLEGVAA